MFSFANSRKITILCVCLSAVAGCGDKQILSENSCSIDSINNIGDSIVIVKRNEIIAISGWTMDKLSKKAPKTVSINFVSSDGTVSLFAEGKLTVPRPDVSAAYKVPAIINSGFGFSARLNTQLPDTYEIQILQHFPDRILVCKPGKGIKVE